MILRKAAIFVLFVFATAMTESAAQTIPLKPQAKVSLAADEVIYDNGSRIITARGDVVLSYLGRVLHADEIILSADNETATAQGNIRLYDPSGNVMTADALELSGDLRDGFIEGVNVLFSDNSRAAAALARRQGGNRNILEYAVYSPCEVCEDNPDRAPKWQIKAQKVIHKEDEQRIVYRNAYLEFFGIPVIWLPWLSHPDPTVDRQSGFLVPEVDSSSELGLMLTVPYYFNIAPHRDFTFAPTITTDEGVVLNGEYRERTKRGGFTIDGSITRVTARDDFNQRLDTKTIRGHAFAKGGFKLNEHWRWGFDGGFTSDDTYMRRYDISEAETITSTVFAQRLDRRSYFSIRSLTFQGLRAEDIPGLTPYVLPRVDYHYNSRRFRSGLRFDFRASGAVLTRSDGFDSRRFSIDTQAELPHISRFGLVTTLRMRLRGDLYHTTDFADPRIEDPPDMMAMEAGSDTEGRLVPQFSLHSRFPLARTGTNITQIIEPVMMFVASPNGDNPIGIPDEDSRSFQFDETTLFETNRFNGYDRWEGGTRVAYGLRYSVIGRKGRSVRLIVGESYSFDPQSAVPDGSGLEGKRSDVVGGFTVNLSDFLEYSHSLRFDKDSFAVRRNEASVLIGPDRFKLRTTYLDIEGGESARFPDDRQEIQAEARLQLGDRWTAMSHIIRDIQGDGRFISAGGGLIYEDECIILQISGRRDFTRDREIRPSTSVGIRISLKHLGV